MKRWVWIVWGAALVYPVLLLLYAWSPEQAVRVYRGLARATRVGCWAGAAGFLLLALLYPPWLERVRQRWKRLTRRATTNWRELQALEARMAEVPTPGLAIRLGHAWFELEDYRRALGWYARARELDPELPATVPFRSGCAWLKLQAPGKALEALQAAFRQDPRQAGDELLLRLGEAYQGVGERAEARRAYEEFERRTGGTPALSYRLGLLHEAEGDRAGARQHMQRALEQYASLPPAVRKAQRWEAAQARWFRRIHW